MKIYSDPVPDKDLDYCYRYYEPAECFGGAEVPRFGFVLDGIDFSGSLHAIKYLANLENWDMADAIMYVKFLANEKEW